MKEIVSNVYFAGVLNPNMRVFDVSMKTEWGTSYNSYVVKGNKKTAVIEGSHATFLENFKENVQEVLGDAPIDYLVLNHTEPDHAGCVGKFVDLYPGIQIICSPAAAIYIKNITNRDDLNIRVVKDGDSIDLGDKTLQFINAPFLHWPDTMFTYLPEDKILFSCDFLGCHYCEPQNYDYRVPYPHLFWDSVKNYYDCIFSPFAKYVRDGLAKIKDLEIDFDCNSHGPILTKNHALPQVIELYAKWSAEKPRDEKEVPIFYCSAYRNTEMLALKIQEGIRKVLPMAKVPAYNIIEHDIEKLHGIMNRSDAFLIGAPTINRDAVPPIWQLLAGMDAINMPKRPVAIFGSYGWGGESFLNVSQRLSAVKATIYPNIYKVLFVPSEEELANAVIFGENFAKSLL